MYSTHAKLSVAIACLIGSVLPIYNSEVDGLISWPEFLHEYNKGNSVMPELHGIREAFPHQNSVTDRRMYIVILSKAFSHLEDLLADHPSHLQARKLKQELLDDIVEFVNSRKTSIDFNLEDFYRDVFLGDLNSWLSAYKFGPDSLLAPSDNGNEETISETALDI